MRALKPIVSRLPLKCAHCKLPISSKPLSLETLHEKPLQTPLYFCCSGCKQVFLLLHSLELESFYTKLVDRTLEPITPIKEHDSNYYNSAYFLKNFTTPLKNGYLEISLLLENIHCAACVWLIERVLLKQEGIKKVQINYTAQRATLAFDPQKINIATILNTIASIGYRAQIYDPRIQDSHARKEEEKAFRALVVGIFASMNVMWIAIANYAGYFSGMDASMAFKLNVASWALASLTLAITGWQFLRGAFYGLKYKFVGMDFSVSVGALGVYGYSIYATFKGLEPYFESVCMLLTFISASKFLELKSRHKANAILDQLQNSLPLQVLVLELENGQIKRVLKEPQEVEIGARIEVLPGECVALDGILKSPSACVSTQAFNGETLPINLQSGDKLLAGYVNHAQAFIYQVTESFKLSFLSQMVQLIQKSFAQKPLLQQKADTLARFFSLVILFIALLGFVVWYFLAGLYKAFMVAMAVVVVACPCAFALAAPIALVVGVHLAFKKGVLFKKTESLEYLAKANTLFLDKTGTLSTGLSVADYKIHAPYNPSLLLSLIWHNSHPISQAISTFLKKDARPDISLQSIKQEEGGLEGHYQDQIVHAGSVAYLKSKGVEVGVLCADFACSINLTLVASFTLNSPLKPKAMQLVQTLKKKGLNLAILSGDSSTQVFEIAKSLNIACFAPLTPQQKLQHIEKALAKRQIVVMVGDGMNDTPSLAKAHVSICMHEGHDLSLLYSDVIVLNNSLEGVLEAFRTSTRVHRLIKQNLALSFLYNTLFIPLALCGLITPLIAALGMGLSSLLVVGNSLRLLSKDF